MKAIFILLVTIITAAGCSGDDNQENKAHVWKEQTDTMNKARAVEGLLQDAAENERKQIEDQTR